MQTYWRDWFAKTTLSADADLIERRQKGIDKFAKSVDRSTKSAVASICELCRLAFGLPEVSGVSRDAFLTRMRTAFAGEDPKFEMLGNALVMRILAGAVLERLLTSSQISIENSDRVALAVKCAPMINGTSDKVSSMLFDLRRSAELYLVIESCKRHRLTPVTELAVTPVQSKVPESLERLSFEGTSGTASAVEHLNITRALVAQIKALVKEMSQLGDNMNAVQIRAVENQKILEEEVNTLWWIFGRRSRGLDSPFEQIAVAPACIIAAKELMETTLAPLGHPAATEFLAAALAEADLDTPDREANDQIQLLDAVKQTPLDWRLEWHRSENQNIVSVEIANLCPVTYAIELSVQAEGDDWVTLWKETTGLPIDYSLAPDDLSRQLYDECLLLRACRAA